MADTTPLPAVAPEPLRDAAVAAVKRAVFPEWISTESAEDLVDAIAAHVVEVVVRTLEANQR